MTKKIILLLVSAIGCLNTNAQSYSGILTHTNSYFTIKPFNSSYDDGYGARLFYDGNKKALIFWNIDPGYQYTNIEVGNINSYDIKSEKINAGRLILEDKLGIGTISPSSPLSISVGGQGINFAYGTNSSGYTLNVGVNDDGVNIENSSSVRGYNFKNSRGTLLTISHKGNAFLNGKFEAKEIKVTATPTADFVFNEGYNLPSLDFIESYVKKNKHLPEVASAEEMKENGVNIGEFQIKLLQKIEELTLYTITQEKKLKEYGVLENKYKMLQEKVIVMERLINQLIEKENQQP
ncbi:hypothetical protein [Galbibacter pacificus]|uniref:Uncharacterized protein n=1 Tax=Galbibacter pacificus TaxID=2996052 RepID=A0ABT6FNU7_9FLAO|nr:hypothetical protein [Galbibacter pacificus]MDG3581261.1 hypothetical protein [Galbibacter pacificus]MDG3584739.1 hypothetical protein [Galbibacter pacificus]